MNYFSSGRPFSTFLGCHGITLISGYQIMDGTSRLIYVAVVMIKDFSLYYFYTRAFTGTSFMVPWPAWPFCLLMPYFQNASANKSCINDGYHGILSGIMLDLCLGYPHHLFCPLADLGIITLLSSLSDINLAGIHICLLRHQIILLVVILFLTSCQYNYKEIYASSFMTVDGFEPPYFVLVSDERLGYSSINGNSWRSKMKIL